MLQRADQRLRKVEPTTLQTAVKCLLTCNDVMNTLTSPRIRRAIRIGMLMLSIKRTLPGCALCATAGAKCAAGCAKCVPGWS